MLDSQLKNNSKASKTFEEAFEQGDKDALLHLISNDPKEYKKNITTKVNTLGIRGPKNKMYTLFNFLTEYQEKKENEGSPSLVLKHQYYIDYIYFQIVNNTLSLKEHKPSYIGINYFLACTSQTHDDFLEHFKDVTEKQIKSMISKNFCFDPLMASLFFGCKDTFKKIFTWTIENYSKKHVLETYTGEFFKNNESLVDLAVILQKPDIVYWLISEHKAYINPKQIPGCFELIIKNKDIQLLKAIIESTQLNNETLKSIEKVINSHFDLETGKILIDHLKQSINQCKFTFDIPETKCDKKDDYLEIQKLLENSNPESIQPKEKELIDLTQDLKENNLTKENHIKNFNPENIQLKEKETIDLTQDFEENNTLEQTPQTLEVYRKIIQVREEKDISKLFSIFVKTDKATFLSAVSEILPPQDTRRAKRLYEIAQTYDFCKSLENYNDINNILLNSSHKLNSVKFAISQITFCLNNIHLTEECLKKVKILSIIKTTTKMRTLKEHLDTLLDPTVINNAFLFQLLYTATNFDNTNAFDYLLGTYKKHKIDTQIILAQKINNLNLSDVSILFQSPKVFDYLSKKKIKPCGTHIITALHFACRFQKHEFLKNLLQDPNHTKGLKFFIRLFTSQDKSKQILDKINSRDFTDNKENVINELIDKLYTIDTYNVVNNDLLKIGFIDKKNETDINSTNTHTVSTPPSNQLNQNIKCKSNKPKKKESPVGSIDPKYFDLHRYKVLTPSTLSPSQKEKRHNNKIRLKEVSRFLKKHSSTNRTNHRYEFGETKLTLNSAKGDLKKNEPNVTFIIAGRKESALIPLQSYEDGRIILILTETEYKNLLKSKSNRSRFLSKRIDVLIIHSIQSTSHGDYSTLGLHLNKPRNIAAWMLAIEMQLDFPIIMDDNIRNIYINAAKDDKKSWPDVYRCMREEMKGNLTASLPTLSNKILKSTNKNRLGTKVFMLDIKAISKKIKNPEHAFILFAPSNCANWWGTDYYFQTMLHYLFLKENISAFHIIQKEKFAIERSSRHKNASKKVLNSPKMYIDNCEQFINGVTLNALPLSFKKAIIDTLNNMRKITQSSIDGHRKLIIKVKKMDLVKAHAKANHISVENDTTLQNSTALTTSLNFNDHFKSLQASIKENSNALSFLYPHQKAAIQSISDLNYKQARIVSATGTGKTMFLYALTHYALNLNETKPLIIITPYQNLVNQTFKKFLEYQKKFPTCLKKHQVIKVSAQSNDVGSYMLAINEKVSQQKVVLIFCARSYNNYLDQKIKLNQPPLNPAMILIDEYHVISKSILNKVFDTHRKDILFGLTATPPEDCPFEHEAFRFSRISALSQNILSPILTKILPKPYSKSYIDINIKTMAYRLNNEIHPCGAPFSKLKGIIYLPSIEHCNKLHRLLQTANIKSYIIHSKNPNYKSKLEEYSKIPHNQGAVILAVRMVRIGFDDYKVSWCKVLKQERHSINYMQIAGRVMRSNPTWKDKIGHLEFLKDADLSSFEKTNDVSAQQRAHPSYGFNSDIIISNYSLSANELIFDLSLNLNLNLQEDILTCLEQVDRLVHYTLKQVDDLKNANISPSKLLTQITCNLHEINKVLEIQELMPYEEQKNLSSELAIKWGQDICKELESSITLIQQFKYSSSINTAPICLLQQDPKHLKLEQKQFKVKSTM